jgi:hypothetical protein
LAIWEKLFRHFLPACLGRAHCPNLCEASHPSTGTMVESPFIWFLFFSGKTSGVFSQLVQPQLLRSLAFRLISPEN